MLRPSIFIFLGKLLPLSFSLIERPRKFRLKDFSSISSEGRDSNCPHFIDLFNGVILTSSFVLESNPSAGLFKVQTNLKPRESSCFFISWDNFCSFWFLHCPQTENVGSSAVEFARRDHIASSFFITSIDRPTDFGNHSNLHICCLRYFKVEIQHSARMSRRD